MTEKTVYNTIKKAWGEIPELSLSSYSQWYYEHRDYCDSLAVKYDLKLSQICGIFAALSPMKSVEENKRLCENFLKGRRGGHFSVQIKKAENIKNTSNLKLIDNILHGDKTVSFFRHLYSPWDNNYCVVDRHMIKLANKGESMYITPRRYRVIAESIKKLSKEVNMKVSETQSCLWYLAKSKYGNNI